MNRKFDVVVVGSGSAGTTVALAARARGRSVAVIDERPFGGTCTLRGCDPKKVLVYAAGVVDAAERLAQLGIVDRTPKLEWAKLMEFKRTFTDPIPAQRRKTYEDAGAVAIHGVAKFTSPQTLAVNGDVLEAAHVVVAAGAKTLHVAQGDEALLTSESFLELESLPESLFFIGGGYIAFEFAHVAARAGAKVTILHRGAQPLNGFDPEVVEQLLSVTREVGIDVALQSTVKRVERQSDNVVAWVERNGEQTSFSAAAGVLAAGRVPDLDDLQLDAGNVERTNHGVKVNQFLQSVSNPNVYAAGDAADGGGLPLTPVAGYEGEVVAANVLDGNHRAAEFRGLASLVYTSPPLATVGLSEDAARAQRIEYDVKRGDMTDWYTTRHEAGRRAYYKVLIEKKTRRILGATILGPHAEEQINVISLAIHNELAADRVGTTLFGYPTGSSDLEYILGVAQQF